MVSAILLQLIDNPYVHMLHCQCFRERRNSAYFQVLTAEAWKCSIARRTIIIIIAIHSSIELASLLI